MTGTPTEPNDAVVARVRRRAESLIGSAEEQRPQGLYVELREQLAAIPEDQRTRAWLEAAVLNDAVFRRRPKVARRRLERVFALYRESGDDAGSAAWWALVSRALGPLALGTHGYRPSLASRDAPALWQEAGRVTDALAARGHPAYAVSGTLLGIVREGGLIGHDDDLDLAVVLTSGDARAAAEEWNDLRQRWAADGLLDDELAWDTYVHVRARSDSGVTIDLFPSWVEAGRAYVWPHTPGTVAAEDLLPLAGVSMGGRTITVPRRAEPLLESNYGPRWRTPDPSWRFDWDAARARFPQGWTEHVVRGQGVLVTDDDAGNGADGHGADGHGADGNGADGNGAGDEGDGATH